MDRGVSFTYKLAAYPRYRFYQQHLQRLVDRWQKILDAGGLPDCVSQGKIKLKEITTSASQIEDKVKVNVFAESAFLETRMSELVLPCNEGISGKMAIFNWSDFIQQDRKDYEPTVTVIVLPSHGEKSLENVKSTLSHLPKVLLEGIIIYFAESKTCFPYTDLAKADLTAMDTGQADSKVADHSKSLNKQIQHLVEDNAVSVLEQIAAYNKVFVPKKQEDLVEPLEHSIQHKILKSMRNEFIVKDLSPDSNDKSEEAERKPTDTELMRIATAVGRNWEMLGPSLGITQEKIDDIKQSHEGALLQIYNMLLLWRWRDGATLRYLLQVMENVSTVIDVDMTVIKEIKEVAPLPKTDSERDKIFHKNLLDFVAKKTKCVACDKLSQKLGMSSSLINEFLNEGFFGYEKKVEEMMNTMILPSWPRDKNDNGVTTCKLFSFRCCSSMSKMIHETEDYITAKHKILMVVKKLQFQLFGLLEETDIEIETQIPELPKLPVDLQHELLDVPGVYGCGTLWGDLVIHVNNELLPVKRDEVKKLLEKYMYVYGFRTEVVEFEREDAGGFTSIEHGNGIRARKLNAGENEDENYKYGSLGCFVDVKPKADEATNATETESKLHALTCAHVVEGCDTNVEIKQEEDYVKLGEKRHAIFEPQSFDVATVEISKTKSGNCDKYLKNSNQDPCKNWRVCDEQLVNKPVFKYGNATGLTRGTCISEDYETKEMMDKWNNVLKEKNENCNFNPVHNILIGSEDLQEGTEGIVGIEVEPEANRTEGQEPMQFENRVIPFSEPGDSGSVVCKDDPENENVAVISILLGSVKTTEGTYCYSNHICRTVEELQRRYDCIIQPAQ